jgi:hypothetical protein
MDHQKIAEEKIVERYLSGQLSPDEEQNFEEHYFDCDQCFMAVKAADRAIPVAAKTKPSFNFQKWLNNFALTPAFAVAAVVMGLALIYPAWRGIVLVSRLQGELQELRQPQANAQNYYLTQARAGERPEGLKIAIKPKEEAFVLTFNLNKSDLGAPHYRAEIIEQNGSAIWHAEDLQATGDYALFSIVCRSSFFNEGLYTLKVYEINPADKRVANEFSFPFEIAFRDEDVEK